jgi:hypothetical protein
MELKTVQEYTIYICKDEIIANARISKRLFHTIVNKAGLTVKCGYSKRELIIIDKSIEKSNLKRENLKKIIKSLCYE